jgi:hypothetical protein
VPLVEQELLTINKTYINIRRVWRYHRSNQNLYIKEEQTTQWPKERKSTKGQTTIYKTYINIRRVWRYLIYRFWLLLWYLQTLLMFMYVLLIVVCPFVLFLLAIELSVLLWYTDSDYSFEWPKEKGQTTINKTYT